MRHIFTLLGLSALPLLAQAQSPRLVLVEHFTQASCGPCATQNPALNALLNANQGMVVAIKYQTSWPGSDPMNAHNPTEVAARVGAPPNGYYGINSVPRSVVDGNQYNGSPGNVSQSMLNNRASVPSPMTVNVQQTFSAGGDSLHVRAVVTKTGNTPAGANLKLRIAIIERDIYFANPPGSNGEKHFASVMKKMLPNAGGTTLAAMSIGDSAVVTGSWKLANVYDLGQLATVAFVQNDVNKEVFQAGYAAPNFPLSMQFAAINNIAGQVAGNNGTTNLNMRFKTMNPVADTYRITMDKSQLPAGWDATFAVNGQTYTDFADIAVGALDSANVQVHIQTGSIPNRKGWVTLRSNSTTTFTDYSVSRRVTAYSHITTGFVNKKPTTTVAFMAAFNFASTDVTHITEEEFRALDPASVEDSKVDQLFVNTSDLYSATLFSDHEINLLTSYLNTGGQVFMSGADIGYSAFDLSQSNLFKNFVNNMLGANYESDGNTTESLSISVPASDTLFTGLTTSALSASTGQYSDHLSVNTSQPNALPLLMYNNDITDLGAVRNNGASWKTVYVGFRMEAISSTAFRNQFVDLAIQWFNGQVSGADFDAQLAELMLKVYPNPAHNQVTVELNELTAPAVLNVYDLLGRVVLSQNVAAGTSKVTVNTAALPSGTYAYRLEGGINTAARKLVVLH